MSFSNWQGTMGFKKEMHKKTIKNIVRVEVFRKHSYIKKAESKITNYICVKLTVESLQKVSLDPHNMPITFQQPPGWQAQQTQCRKTDRNKMAGHSDVFPVNSNNTIWILSAKYVTVYGIRQITIFNGQITVILSENSLKQYINQEATYLPHFIEIGPKRNNNGF